MATRIDRYDYTCHGPVRGQCGTAHRSEAAARACCARDERDCARNGGYSDRRPAAIIDGRLERDGAPVWPAHGRSSGSVRAQCGGRR